MFANKNKMRAHPGIKSCMCGKPSPRFRRWLAGIMACAWLCMLAGCGRGISARLALINDLMEEHPDSALALINGIDTVVAFDGDKDRALYYLLATEAQYKCYKPLTVADRLDFSISYFSAEGSRAMLARCYHYKAMHLLGEKEYARAVELSKKAEKEAAEARDTVTLAKVYEALAFVNDRLGNHSMQLGYAERCLALSRALGNSSMALQACASASKAFLGLGQPDSARACLAHARALLGKVDLSDKAYILTNIGCMQMREGRDSLAEQTLLQSLRLQWRHNTMAALAVIYTGRGEHAKADSLWQLALATDRPKLKVAVLNSYAGYLSQCGRMAEANEALRQRMALSDSVAAAESDKSLTALQLKYDTQVIKASHYQTLLRLSIVIGVLLLLVVCVVLVLLRLAKKKARLEQEVEESKALIIKNLSMISQLEALGVSDKKIISGLKSEIEKLSKDHFKTLGIGREVMLRIMEKDFAGLAKAKSWRPCLVLYYSIYNYKLYLQWKQMYADLTDGLALYLILWQLGCSDGDIVQVLGVADTTVRTAKAKLKKMKVDDASLQSEEEL